MTKNNHSSCTCDITWMIKEGDKPCYKSDVRVTNYASLNVYHIWQCMWVMRLHIRQMILMVMAMEIAKLNHKMWSNNRQNEKHSKGNRYQKDEVAIPNNTYEHPSLKMWDQTKTTSF
jgi:hypothetical protein